MSKQFKINVVQTGKEDVRTVLEKVEDVLCYILEKEGALSDDHSMNANEIWACYQTLLKSHPNAVRLNQNTLANYSSILAKRAFSVVQCNGRKQGYYLSPVGNTSSNWNRYSMGGQKPYSERDLYPILEQWMRTSLKMKYVKDVSNIKAMGKWGNPDIAGIAVHYCLGETKVLLTTIEVKKSLVNWRQEIFEAVAHTLISNYSYFAYLKKVSDASDRMITTYAREFGIGIIEISVPDKEWGKKTLASTHYSISVMAPAQRKFPIESEQEAYFMALGINDRTDLASWIK